MLKTGEGFLIFPELKIATHILHKSQTLVLEHLHYRKVSSKPTKKLIRTKHFGTGWVYKSLLWTRFETRMLRQVFLFVYQQYRVRTKEALYVTQCVTRGEESGSFGGDDTLIYPRSSQKRQSQSERK